jgi:hypothetical protein
MPAERARKGCAAVKVRRRRGRKETRIRQNILAKDCILEHTPQTLGSSGMRRFEGRIVGLGVCGVVVSLYALYVEYSMAANPFYEPACVTR